MPGTSICSLRDWEYSWINKVKINQAPLHPQRRLVAFGTTKNKNPEGLALRVFCIS